MPRDRAYASSKCCSRLRVETTEGLADVRRRPGLQAEEKLRRLSRASTMQLKLDGVLLSGSAGSILNLA